MKKTTNKVSALALVIVLGFLPAKAFAATVYLETANTNVSVGDTIIVTAKINSEGVTLNAVEGDIVTKAGSGNLAVQEFSLANSAFGLWPRTPSLSADGLSVSFAGGVPGGFNIEGATLFKIIYQAKKVGSLTISPQNIVVFANDGKGTKLPVTMKGLTLNVGAKKAGSATTDEWATLVSADKISPENFIIVLGQDSNLFDGKKFAYFSAVDNQSGISHYQVSENGGPSVRSGSTYVLQNQTGDVKLSVTAVDKAGNMKVATYSSPVPVSSQNGIAWTPVIIVTLLIVGVWALIKKLRAKK